MRDRPSIRVLSIVLLLLAAGPIAAAEPGVDKVTIDDGSVLNGTINRVENDQLVLTTDFSNKVTIGIKRVVAIESNQLYSIRLIGGEIVTGYLSVSNGKIVVREELATTGDSEDAPQPIETDLEIGEPEIAPSAEIPVPVAPIDGRELEFSDVDWIRQKQVYFRYKADLNIGAQLARGNTDTTDLHFDALAEPSFGWNTIRISGQYDKKRADGDTTMNRWTAALAYERDLSRRWFIGADNSYESDRQRDLDLRITTAAGFGYRFFEAGPTSLSVLPGIAYVIENFSDNTQDDDYAAFHWKLIFSRDLLGGDINLFHNNRYVNNLQTPSDITVETRTGIKFKMPWNLVLSAEAQTAWENRPAQGSKKLDTRYLLTIGFGFQGDQLNWLY